MFRRLALLFLAAAAFAAPVHAQQVYKVGFLGQASSLDLTREIDALVAGLRAHGYEEGKNLTMEYRWADRKLDRLPALAAQLVAAKVDVIVTHGSAGSRAAKGATSTIPVVIAAIGDPVADGLVATLARPGGNVTGLVLQEFESTVKWLELLKQVLPRGSRIGWLEVADVESPEAAEKRRRNEDEAARARGFEVQRVTVSGGAGDLQQAIEKLSKEAHAVIVPNSSLLNPHAELIARLAVTYKLPSVGSTAFARGGGLMAYGPDAAEMYRRAARYVDLVLKGAKAGDLPMEGPPKLELSLNLKTAGAIGVRFPEELIAQADYRIE